PHVDRRTGLLLARAPVSVAGLVIRDSHGAVPDRQGQGILSCTGISGDDGHGSGGRRTMVAYADEGLALDRGNLVLWRCRRVRGCDRRDHYSVRIQRKTS